jgi:hypothetical protein
MVSVGVPLKRPVDALKVKPAGTEGEIVKLEIVPPLEEIVYPLSAEVLAVKVSEVLLKVKDGITLVVPARIGRTNLS